MSLFPVCWFVCFPFQGYFKEQIKAHLVEGQNIITSRELKEPMSQQQQASNTLQETLPAGLEPAQGVSPLSYSNSCRCRANNKLVNLLRERKLAKIMTQKNSPQKKFREEVDS